MSEHAHDWSRRANKLAKTLRYAARKFATFSETYEGERNKNPSPSNSVKTRVDASYGRLADAKQALCEMQAGGRRRTRKRSTKKQRKTRRHH